MTMAMQPAGVTFKRDNADVMNNFFINLVAFSYTNIEETLRTNAEDNNSKAIKQTLADYQKIQSVWTNKINGDVNKQYSGFDNVIEREN